MDDNLGYVFAAFAISWLVIAGYLLYLGQQARALRDEVAEISELDASPGRDERA